VEDVSFLCCPIAVDAATDVPHALERAAEAAAAGARLVEWRVDILAEDEGAVAAIRRLVKESPLPCIVTVRPTWEGGHFAGSETDRVSLLEAIGTGDAGESPRYLDVELDAYAGNRNRKQKFNLAVDHENQVREVAPRLILSSHDFRGRPEDLLQRVARMAGEPACAVMKVVWTARSLRDNLEAFDLMSARTKPMSAICMGEFGGLSRILAPKFGALLAYAPLDAEFGTAPGQLTIGELRGTYRFDAIGPATRVYGIIGWPVAHSRSPAFHNARFAERGIDAVYAPMPIAPGWEPFAATVSSLLEHPRLDFRGASVTIPHKENLLRFVQEAGGEVEPLAATLGAANTLVVCDDGRLACLNTDAPAAVECLAKAIGRKVADPLALRGIRVAVVGVGGAGRAVAGGAAFAGADVILFNRDHAKAEQVAKELGESVKAAGATGRILAGKNDALGCGCFEAMVNCTPLGMKGGPGPDENPFESIAGGDVAFPEGTVVFDTVYAPEWTPLLKEARARQARCVSGLAMFDAQARRQAEVWATGGRT
jgi:3-dehydroquinate dehydratase/shikimate dehydrogenase